MRMFDRLSALFLLIFACFVCHADVVLRTESGASTKDVFFVAVDFSLKNGEHITAPVGNGKSMSPKFEFRNAVVLDAFWPESKPLLDSLGKDTGYLGYDSNFSVLLSVSRSDKSVPIEYDFFYVICDDSCRPVTEEGILDFNSKLKQDEILKIRGETSEYESFSGFFILLLTAFLGGIILNCMPCVFPVISLKLFSLVKHSQESSSGIRRYGVFYAFGTVGTFLVLGNILLALRSFGESAGWGFFMQSPLFTCVLLCVFILCALYFFNVFSMPGFSVSNRLLNGSKNPNFKSFLNGVFTAVASATCVGPFVGVAVSSALAFENIFESETIFLMLGLGVAFPIVSVCFIPKFANVFPKAGNWMNIFKQIMGFMMLLACVWPLFVLSSISDSYTFSFILFLTIVFCLFVFLLEKSRDIRSDGKRNFFVTVFLLCAVCSQYMIISKFIGSSDKTVVFEKNNDDIGWEEFSFEKLAKYRSEDKPVFINFTAAWCLTCQMNKLVFEEKKVKYAFKKNSVVCMKMDWTNKDDNVTKSLEFFGSVSVPFYVYYPKGSEKYIVLPSVLNVDDFIKILEN